MMTRRIKQVPPVRGIDVKEDAWDDDGLFFEEFFEECLVELVSDALEGQALNP